MRLTDLLNLSNVPRWGIVPRLAEQSVADHSFRVAAIYIELCDRLKVAVSLGDLVYALFHDGEESWTGDISGVAKHAVPDLKRGSKTVEVAVGWIRHAELAWPPVDRQLVKCADIIECITWARAWIPEPRRAYVLERNMVALDRHCSRYHIDLTIAHQIVEDIMDDTGRCLTPAWAHPFDP